MNNTFDRLRIQRPHQITKILTQYYQIINESGRFFSLAI